jgi:tetratricopeptide (TPR) repeat protein
LIANAAGDLDESAKAYRRALELSPQRFVSHALLSLVLMEAGKTTEAFEAANAEPDDFWRIWALAILHYLSGSGEEAETELQRLITEFSDGNAYQIAEVLAIHNKNNEAFEWLERANGERDAGVTHAKVNRRFRALHTDPRWQTLLSKIGFET